MQKSQCFALYLRREIVRGFDSFRNAFLERTFTRMQNPISEELQKSFWTNTNDRVWKYKKVFSLFISN